MEWAKFASLHAELRVEGKNTSERDWRLFQTLTNWRGNPWPPLFEVNHTSHPIDDLGVIEAFFLSESVSDPTLVRIKNDLSNLIALWRKEHEREDAIIYSYEYEKALQDFMHSENIDAAYVHVDSDEEGNPYLSYGHPLSGHPITVDTQFDDETILKEFKKWLAGKRKQEGESARRPFNDDDFSDWQYYKIRELYDLTVWSQVHEVKILDRVLASALWPNASDDFSPIEVLRTTARKKAAQVFQWSVAVRLYGQLRLEHGENFLAE